MEAKSCAGAMRCMREQLIDQLINVMNLDGHAANEWNDMAGRFNSLVTQNKSVGPFIMSYVDGIIGEWKIESSSYHLYQIL